MKSRAEKYFEEECERLEEALKSGEITPTQHAKRMRDLEKECAEEDGE